MALQPPRPYNECYLCEGTTSIATTPVIVTITAPVAGYVERIAVSAGGTFTGTITTTVKINGGADICGGNFTLAAQTGSVNGAVFELALVGAGTTSGVYVNEGDNIVLTPSGGTGATIQGGYTVVIRKGD